MGARSSSLVDTRVIYCGDNLEQLGKLPEACVDLIYIDPPFNSNRNYEVFWGETKEKWAFEDRHESTKAYFEYMRPRCGLLARVLKKTGSFYYHCDWHASHYVKVMLDRVFGENNFQNEIVWKRSGAHSDSKRYGANHDTVFFYTNGKSWTWNKSFTAYSPEYVEQGVANAAAIGTFGTTAADLAALDTAILDYESLATAPRQTRVLAKGVTGDIALDEAAADKLLKQELDKTMRKFKRKEPKFAQAYADARIIIDLGGGQKPPTPPTPPTGPATPPK